MNLRIINFKCHFIFLLLFSASQADNGTSKSFPVIWLESRSKLTHLMFPLLLGKVPGITQGNEARRRSFEPTFRSVFGNTRNQNCSENYRTTYFVLLLINKVEKAHVLEARYSFSVFIFWTTLGVRRGFN